ncbi:zinc finger protein 25-like [Sagmatias obliquidens]|nr:zinc finger protein 25-like [Lagenorhynchus obliquidens]
MLENYSHLVSVGFLVAQPGRIFRLGQGEEEARMAAGESPTRRCPVNDIVKNEKMQVNKRGKVELPLECKQCQRFHKCSSGLLFLNKYILLNKGDRTTLAFWHRIPERKEMSGC